MQKCDLLSIYIQAGGKSTRLGTNKAMLPLEGISLIQRVVEKVMLLSDEIMIISDQSAQYSFLHRKVIPDIIPNLGAMGGLFTSLMSSTKPYVAFIACDMPFLSTSLIEYEYQIMINGEFDIIMPRSIDGYEPLHSIYRCDTCIPTVKQMIQSENYRLSSLLLNLNCHILAPEEIRLHDPDGRAFININTQEDLKIAEAILSEKQTV